jgi:hypothetical protein
LLVAAFYLFLRDEDVLESTTAALIAAIQARKSNRETPAEMIIMGDFNRYNHLWGGFNINERRVGETDPSFY